MATSPMAKTVLQETWMIMGTEATEMVEVVTTSIGRTGRIDPRDWVVPPILLAKETHAPRRTENMNELGGKAHHRRKAFLLARTPFGEHQSVMALGNKSDRSNGRIERTG